MFPVNSKGGLKDRGEHGRDEISSSAPPRKRPLSSSSGDDSDEFSNNYSEEFNKKVAVFARQDLILKVGKTKLHVSKEQLMQESPVFERMFGGEFKEKCAKEITLPWKRPKDFVDFLRCTLPGIDDEITEETVHAVIPIAHEYQAERSLTKADKFLEQQCKKLGNELTSEAVIEKIIEAETYQLPSYLSECINIASRKYYKKLIQNANFKNISQETSHKICLKRLEGIDTLYEKTNGFRFFIKIINNQAVGHTEIQREHVVDALKQFMYNN